MPGLTLVAPDTLSFAKLHFLNCGIPLFGVAGAAMSSFRGDILKWSASGTNLLCWNAYMRRGWDGGGIPQANGKKFLKKKGGVLTEVRGQKRGAFNPMAVHKPKRYACPQMQLRRRTMPRQQDRIELAGELRGVL